MTTPKKKILVSVAKNSHSEKRRHALVCGNYVDWLQTGFKNYDVWAVDPSDKKKVLRSVEDIVGIVFTGGVDISPKMYGEEPNSHAGNPNLPRDQFEAMLFDLFQPKNIPTFGMGRGAQLVNVKLGGKLKQHVGDAHKRVDAKKDTMHKVDLKKDSRLVAVFKSPVIEVNSAHHQAVDAKHLGKGLRVSGTAKEVVEVLENADPKGAYTLLVQWHPERMKSSPVSKKLLADFEQAVEAFVHPPVEKAPAKEKQEKKAPAKKPAAKAKKKQAAPKKKATKKK